MNAETKMESSLIADYASKKQDYFDCPRPEMLKFLPESYKTVLDVGCGSGAFAASLRNQQKCEVWGVEPDPDSVREARKKMDNVLEGCFVAGMELPANHFDCIIFNDVIEHILHPIPVLEFAKSLLSKNGVIVASIPNIGHFPTIWRLMIQGRWDYRERGILDKTHLRFYTRKNIVELFEQVGLKVETIEGVNPYHEMEDGDKRLWRRYKLISWLPFCGVRDSRYLQFGIRASK